MLIKGKDLNQKQTDQVLNAFIYRWTFGNPARERVYQNIDKPTIDLQSDSAWLDNHAFYFIKDGSRLMLNRNHCESAFMAV